MTDALCVFFFLNRCADNAFVSDFSVFGRGSKHTGALWAFLRLSQDPIPTVVDSRPPMARAAKPQGVLVSRFTSL